MKKNNLCLVVFILLIIQVIPTNAEAVAPVAVFTISPESPLINEIVVFDASTSYDPDGSIVSYKWNFGDGSGIITIPNPVTGHAYTLEGNYNVTLTITDNNGLTDSTSKILTVRKHPVATFTYSPDYPLVDETITFNASLSTPEGGTIINYDWNFGDAATKNVTISVTTHVYTLEGNYTVTLTVTDSENLTDTYSKPISIRKHPVATFTHSLDYPLVDETITFNASLSTPEGGTIINYDWNFGDAANGTSVITTHAYAAVGDYNVTLTITDSEGLTDTAWNLITVVEIPEAIFEYNPTLPLVNEIVQFDASDSTPNGGTIINYTWNFGDGSPEATEIDSTVTHAYTTFGIYNVTLVIMDSENLSDSYSDTIRILIAPTANFTYSPTTPIVNETLTFDASASYDPDDTILSYAWNFGDNTTGTGNITTHAYTATGTYNVTLTVTDGDDLTDSTWQLITVYTVVYTHDVAVVSVELSVTEIFVGRLINITVVVRNEGTAVETFNVTVFYEEVEIETQAITYLLQGTETTLVFQWDTTGVPPGIYNITAQANVVQEETDTSDNTLINGTIKIKILGDADGSGRVVSNDFFLLVDAFGSRPGDSNWNPDCDFDDSGRVSSNDFFLLVENFGKSI